MSTITIVGLGPGRVEELTLAAWRTLENASDVYLRTNRHPLVQELPPNATYHSFDVLYDAADSFDTLYAEIVERLLSLAVERDTVIYAVPGHPLVGEQTTTLLLERAASLDGVDVEIVAGLSFIEPALTALGLDAMAGLQVHDALDMVTSYHPPLNPDYPTLIAQVYSRDVAANLKLTLMNQYPDEYEVTLLHGAGTNDAQLERVPLHAIDHSQQISHLTTLYVPALEKASSFEAFQNVVAHLRSEVGCPWDREQTHESLRPQLLEETYEVLEAIDAGDMDALREELGDLLLHVIFQAQIATEDADFYTTDVIETIIAKLIRRHPHVWGEVDVDGSGQVVANWEAIKQQEQERNAQEGKKARESQLDGVPISLPALVYAYRMQERAAGVGFDWDDVEPVIAKVYEEIEEIKADPSSNEIGDLLFAVVNWARWLGVDAESALRETNARFKRRFRYIEQRAAATGRKMQDMTLQEMDVFWDEAKGEGL